MSEKYNSDLNNCRWKYRQINESTFSILINEELWFSKPQNFNDPFDCQIDLRSFNATIASQDVLPNSDWIKKNLKDEFAYLCMCRKWDQTLMWSHYANEHKGIAFGFDSEFAPSVKVKEISYDKTVYSNKLSSLKGVYSEIARKLYLDIQGTFLEPDDIKNYYNHLYSLYEEFRYLKAECWRYEEEERLEISNLNESIPGIEYKFPPTSLKHVIFGLKCNKSSEKTIINLLSSDKWNHVKIWKAYAHAPSMTLRVKPVKRT